MTCAPWFDVGRRTASVAAPRALANNLALAVWGAGPLLNPALQARRPNLVLTRAAGHAIRCGYDDDLRLNSYAMAYRPDRMGD